MPEIARSEAGQKPVVLHIAPTPFFADRGCHIRIFNEIQALKPHPVAVHLCTYHHGRNMEGSVIHRIGKIPGYSKLDAGFSPYRFLADILLFFLVLKTAWRLKPMVLHGHLHEGALIGWAVRCCLFWRRIPVIMDMQGSLSGELESYGTLQAGSVLARAVATVERLICAMPRFTFCSSEQARETLLRRFKVRADKASVLPDVVPAMFFTEPDSSELKQKYQVPENKTIVLYTGSLLPGKGFDHVLETTRKILAKGGGVFFILLGYPVESAQNFVEQHGLSDSVLLPGQVDYTELPRWLAMGDIALEPKDDESGEASGKLLNYMASGLPVVCFDTLNNRKILGELGVYADDNSTEAFARALGQALGDDSRELFQRGALGREIIHQQYSPESIGNMLMQQYQLMQE